ncbi:MAG TPA: translocation/assembly module TamB domain-containing protein [Paludibacter sp.]|nr:translocation/assembly module TamB domain-containing protein [Paludibacter sp.]
MSKSIKKTITILSFILAGIILIFASVPVLLQSDKIQNYIAQKATQELSVKLNTKVKVGKVNYKLFNSLEVNDFYIEDLEKDTLAYVNKIDLNFKLWEFFKGKIIFTNIELNQFSGNIKIDKDGNSNINFIVKAFEKPTPDSSVVEYHIKNLTIKESSLNFTDLRKNPSLPVNVINTSRLKVKNINAQITVDKLNKDTLSARVKSFSATEKSGLTIKNITTQIHGNKKGYSLPEFQLLLPKSELNLTDIRLNIDTITEENKVSKIIRWNAPLVNSRLSFADFAAFVPEFKRVKGAAEIKGIVSGRLSSLRLKDIEIKYGKSFLLKTDIDLNGLTNIADAFIFGNINDLKFEKSDVQDFISELTGKPFILPKELNELGLINYKGNITGFYSNLVAYGNLNTNLGSLSTDILLKFDKTLKDLSYNGTIKTASFNLNKLLGDKAFGKTAFEINTNGTKLHDAAFKGTIKANVSEFYLNNYTYRDVKFDGKYDGTGFNGNALIEDKNINARFKGIIDLTQKLPVYDFDIKIEHANFYVLNLIKDLPKATISFTGKTNMVGNSLDNLNGFVRFDSITLENNNKVLNVNKIQFTSTIENGVTDFKILSDYLNGSISGNFKYSTVDQSIIKILQYYLPALSSVKNGSKSTNSNVINVNLSLQNTNEISDVFSLPYSLSGISKIQGKIDERVNQIQFNGTVPTFKFNRMQFDNVSLNVERVKQELQLSSRAQMHDKSGIINIFLNGKAAKDSLSANFGWQNTQKITNAGELNTVTLFRKENGKTAAQMQLLASQVIINDSIWDIRKSSIDIKPDSSIQVHNFRFENSKQYIHIDGLISKKPTDSITVAMNDLDLGFILKLANLNTIKIGGFATGKATFFGLLKETIFEADLFVKDVNINDVLLADGKINSAWDNVNKQILLKGEFFNDKNTLALANGVYVPKNDSLDVLFDASGISLQFIQRYFDGIVSNFKGDGYGKLRLFGPTKYLLFDGKVFVDKGQATIDVTKSTYYFSDTVYMQPKALKLKNITLYDQDKNQATLNGNLTHNGFFQQLEYNLNIRGRNIQAMNTQSQDSEFFYGKAYVTGNVHIYGDEKETNLDIKAVSQPKTKCYIQMDVASTAMDNNFINFVSPDTIAKKEEPAKTTKNDINVKVDMQIDVTPEADLELIVDSKAGDMITAKGNGSLRVQFDSFSDLKLYGTYTIEQGNYLFTLQTLIRKAFKIDRGSTISWTGNPYDAQVNINAIYSLTASLSDLMDKAELEGSTTRTSVPVNCVLKLTDNLMSPTIKFDIDLPSSDEGLKQKVRNIINTEELMNRQIVYLLLLNKFYTPDYMRTDPVIGVNEGLSFATSTLSAHINNWLQQSFNSNNLSVGFDWQKSEVVNDEWKAQVLYQPNNRLIVNGNFGYRNEIQSTNNSKFIGDFDVEWLLTEMGKIRFKAYSHTIDRAQLRQAKSTQGVGLLYREDFDSWSDLFVYYWEKIIGNKKKKK